MAWIQAYDPFNSPWLSTTVAALPVIVLLGSIAFFEIKAHWAAILGLISALGVAILGFNMPVHMAGMSAAYGAAFGLLPIGWLVLNIIFLYQLTNEKGAFDVLQRSISSLSDDKRLQLLFISFSLGAFFEGAAGFGTPVAVTAAMLIGLDFSPLAASGLSLIANTAPVAYGALGTPVIALAAVTGLDLQALSGMIGRQLPFFSLLVPFWLIWAFVGFRSMMEVWPAILIAGISFALPQYLVSNFHGPWLVDVVAAIVSMVCLWAFLRIWQPKRILRTMPVGFGKSVVDERNRLRANKDSTSAVVRAWMPWIILSVFVFTWGTPQVKTWLDGIWIGRFSVDGLHNLVFKAPPVATKLSPEAAVYALNFLSAAGTGIFLAAIVSGLLLGFSPLGLAKVFWRTLVLVSYSLLTISCMLSLGFVTKYSGADATLGLAMAKTGVFFPFFGTMIGWLGVALTGSDTSSNVLFGGLQRTSAEQLGLNPVLMAAANSSGGVMGKMIDAQSIVVASTATKWYGHEGTILRFVFFHSIALVVLVSSLVFGQAYLWPLKLLVQ
ncbi:L-lactate permease [Methylocystaceae bacterium]|nr:L-lactate permease [Methylocystaceae bacterium]